VKRSECIFVRDGEEEKVEKEDEDVQDKEVEAGRSETHADEIEYEGTALSRSFPCMRPQCGEVGQEA